MKSKVDVAAADAWCDAWMQSVAKQPASMSQRKMTTVESKGGGVGTLRRIAKKHGVHLLQLTDDKGDVLIAASAKYFRVIA